MRKCFDKLSFFSRLPKLNCNEGKERNFFFLFHSRESSHSNNLKSLAHKILYAAKRQQEREEYNKMKKNYDKNECRLREKCEKENYFIAYNELENEKLLNKKDFMLRCIQHRR